MAEAAPTFFLDHSGSVVPVAADQAANAAQLGWLPASPKQVADFQVQAKYGGDLEGVKAFAEHAASALTLGASDVAERALGFSTPEAMAGREKVWPVASGVGTAVGVAAPLIASFGGASAFTAPSLIARAGQAATRATEAALPAGASALGRMAVRATSLMAGSSIEGAAYGLGQVVHEAALGDFNLTAESALATVAASAGLGGALGGAGGLLAQGFREIGPSDIGAKLKGWLGEFEGERNLKAAGAIQQDIKLLVKQKGRGNLNAIGREAGDMGLVSALSTPQSALEKSHELMQETGQAMGVLLRGADAAAGDAAPKMTDVLDRMHSEVLAPMRSNPFKAPMVDKISETMAGYQNRSGFQSLHEIRQQVSDEIYGLRGQLDPEGSYRRSALREVRHLISDEMNDSLDRAGGLSGEWKTLNRRYEVASTISDIADAGVNRAHGNNMVSPTEFIAGVTQGPVGAFVTAAARRHASGLLGAVAGSARRALEGSTSEVIAAARRAGQDTLTAEATNRPETVAALSLLERMKQSVSNQIDDGVSTIVRAGPKAAKVGRGEVAAGIAVVFGKSHQDATAVYSKRVGDLQKLAQNPQEFHNTLERQTDDWHEHAPNTAFAVQTTSARAVSFLASKLPQHDQPGMLAPKWVPTKSEVARFNRYYEAVQHPQSILKQASAGTLTPEALEAVRTVYPALFTQIQSKLIEKMTSEKTIPYKSRLMLSMLLGQNIDGSTNGMTIARNQMAMLVKAAQQPMPQKPMKFSRADQAMTDTQASESRGDE